MSTDTATFTFSSPTHSFGTWMTGLQTTLFDDTTFNTSALTAVPEPATLALFGSVLAGLAPARRRRGMQTK